MDISKLKQSIDNIIITNGIPKYVKIWEKKRKSIKVKTWDHLQLYIKLYHHHSFVYFSEDRKVIINKYKLKNKLPDITTKNNVFIIKYYGFDNDVKPSQEKLVNYVKNKLDKNLKQLTGIIIDLRKHHGGNMYPFIYSLSSILNNTTLLSFTNRKIKKLDKSWVNMINEEIIFDDKFLSDELPIQLPIAIIIGKQTASAGEFDAIIFKGRKNTKFFGNDTYGSLSANKTIEISKDILFVMTETLVEDVKFKLYESEKLKPDVYTVTPIKDAIKWIKNI